MVSTLREIEEKVIPVLRRHGVLGASVFGSFARGEATGESDVDVLVELPEGKTLFDLGELKLDLEEALGRSVHVLTYEELHPGLREQILSEQVAVL